MWCYPPTPGSGGRAGPGLGEGRDRVSPSLTAEKKPFIFLSAAAPHSPHFSVVFFVVCFFFLFPEDFSYCGKLQPALSSSEQPRSSQVPWSCLLEAISPSSPHALVPARRLPGTTNKSAQKRVGTSISPTTASANEPTAGSSASARQAASRLSSDAC